MTKNKLNKINRLKRRRDSLQKQLELIVNKFEDKIDRIKKRLFKLIVK